MLTNINERDIQQVAGGDSNATSTDTFIHDVETEQCTFDLHNLVAMNLHQIDTARLFSSRVSSTEVQATIPFENGDVAIDEGYLLEKASNGCAQLIASLWDLPIERSDTGPMVLLPMFDGSSIPRALVSGCFRIFCLAPNADVC